MVRRAATSAFALLASLVAAGCFGGTSPGPPDDAEYVATIRWTSYGVPHIEGETWADFAYGYGYAGARDYLCTLAEEFVTVNGERSLYFGPDGAPQPGYLGTYPATNLESDAFFRLLKEDPGLIAASSRNLPAAMEGLPEAFAAGYNRFLAEATPQQIGPCAGEPWLRPITGADLERRIDKLQLFASGYQFMAAFFAAAPPGVGPDTAGRPTFAFDEERPFGSNAYAFGRDATADGRGMLLANPHFPWSGPERFHMLHVTVPGEADVMGMALLGVPMVLIGFTERFAWSHTVSPAWRFSVYELRLDPSDPTAYLYDGERRQMTTKDVTVPVREASGAVSNVTHTFYFSHHGPVLELDVVAAGALAAGLEWTDERAYAIRDANAQNDRIVQQFHALGTASTFEGFQESLLDIVGIPWVHTTAAARDGAAFFGDVSVVPYVTHEQLQTCNTPLGVATAEATAPYRLYVLDGSTARCEWVVEPEAPQPGIVPGRLLPKTTHGEYLINANDNHWLPNPDVRLEGFPPMMGDEESVRSLRTRMGYALIEEQLSGRSGCDIDPDVSCDKMTQGRLQALLYSNRALAAELALEDVIAGACTVPTTVTTGGEVVDLGPACDVLKAWDGRAELDSRGLWLFHRFWSAVPDAQKLWSVPFDAQDPEATPRDLVGEDPRLRDALAGAVIELDAARVPLDASVREVQLKRTPAGDIALHGGPGILGIANVQQPVFVAGQGYAEVDPETGFSHHGGSFIATVTWDEDGPVADAVLTYGQSTRPGSAHFADQTVLYAEKRWHRLPFLDHEIESDDSLTSLTIWQ